MCPCAKIHDRAQENAPSPRCAGSQGMAEVAGQVEMPGGPLERLVSDTHGPVGITDHMIDVGTNGHKVGSNPRLVDALGQRGSGRR